MFHELKERNQGLPVETKPCWKWRRRSVKKAPVKTTSSLLFKALWSSRGSNNSVATTSVPHPFTTMNKKERKKERRRNKPLYREITLESSRPPGLEKKDSKCFLSKAIWSSRRSITTFVPASVYKNEHQNKKKKTKENWGRKHENKQNGTREQQSRKLGGGKNRTVGKWFVAWSCSCSWGALVFAGGLVNSMCKEKSRGKGRCCLPRVHLHLLPPPTASLRPSPVLQEVPQRRVKPTHGGVATNWRQRILSVWDRLWRVRAPSVCQTDGTTD